MSLIGFLRGEEPGPVRRVVVGLKEGKGGLGEYLTEYALEHGRLPGEVTVLRNVLVPRTKGPTSESEVDVLMLHESGIYVMESKNYGGWIFGGADQRQWTQAFETGCKERFYNPIMQNRTHVRALATYLCLPEDAFRSYIVFSERCELKRVPPDTEAYVICKRDRILGVLRKDMAERGAMFPAGQLSVLRAPSRCSRPAPPTRPRRSTWGRRSGSRPARSARAAEASSSNAAEGTGAFWAAQTTRGVGLRGTLDAGLI